MRARLAHLPVAPTPLQSLIARRWRPQWICQSCQSRQFPRRWQSTSPTTTDDTMKPFYATTPIFYVNAAPHVGHMYTLILTDVLKRWQQLKGRKALLCIGTDEHGLKVQQAAAKARIDPQQFCDKGAEVFRNLAAQIDISNDIFIRTSDPKHKDAVEYAWQMLENERYIYEGKHEGWYSVSDETFYPSSQVQLIVDPPTGRKIMVSLETGKEVEWMSERNYMFRLSAFRDRLLDFYRQTPNFVMPRVKMDDVVRDVTNGLEDLSISRPTERLAWGVRVPNDPSQTIYVWLDALLNYATAIGYPFAPGSARTSGWPPDIQVIGKDIVRFHCIYWPAFLMALDLPLPKQILVHSHWTLGRQKMSKSTGTGVNPFFALDRFGLDTMRWYLVHDGGIADDAAYDNRFVIARYKKHLQGGLGNLASRIMRFKGWSVRRAVQRFTSVNADSTATAYEPADGTSRALYDALQALPSSVEDSMRDLLPNRALQKLMDVVGDANAHFQQAEPWKLARGMASFKLAKEKAKAGGTSLTASTTTTTAGASEDSASVSEEDRTSDARARAELDRIVYLDAEALRLVGIMLQPFIPDAARRLLDMLGVRPERRGWEWCGFGLDGEYGTPLVEIGMGEEGLLFPGLTSEF